MLELILAMFIIEWLRNTKKRSSVISKIVLLAPLAQKYREIRNVRISIFH